MNGWICGYLARPHAAAAASAEPMANVSDYPVDPDPIRRVVSYLDIALIASPGGVCKHPQKSFTEKELRGQILQWKVIYSKALR